MSPELADVAERLNKLESQNRKLKRFLAVILLLVGAVLLMGQAKPGVVKTASLQARVDASCGVRPHLSVRTNERADLRSRQVKALIPQREQRCPGIAKETPSVFVISEQPADGELDCFLGHDDELAMQFRARCIHIAFVRSRM